MPPRTRKTAETAPPAPDTTTAAGESEQQVPGSTGAETQTETEPAPQTAAGEAESTQLSPEAQAVVALIEAPSIVYRWHSVTGGDSAPCRVCAPAGPPLGAGSFGCPHGQWVRVQDSD